MFYNNNTYYMVCLNIPDFQCKNHRIENCCSILIYCFVFYVVAHINYISSFTEHVGENFMQDYECFSKNNPSNHHNANNVYDLLRFS